MAVWTAHLKDKHKETTQHCTEWIKQNTKERRELGNGRTSEEGVVSLEERNHPRRQRKQQATETGQKCSFLSGILQGL
jgi:hypothetical protein